MQRPLATAMLITALCLPAGSGPAQEAGLELRSSLGPFLAAAVAFEADDLIGSAELMARALDTDPSNPDLLRRAFSISLPGAPFAETLMQARRLESLGESEDLINLALLIGDIADLEYGRGLDRVAQISRTGLNRFLLPLLEAWCHVGLDDPASAMEVLRPLEEMEGFAALAAFHRAMILDYRQDFEAAEGAFQVALEGGATFRLVEAYGSLLQRLGKQDAALELYGRFDIGSTGELLFEDEIARVEGGGVPAAALVRTPVQGAAEGIFQISSALSREDAKALALTHGRMAVFLEPNISLAWLLLGDVLDNLRQREAAIDAYLGTPGENAAAWSARVHAARVVAGLGRTLDAIDLIFGVIDERPERSEAVIQLADIHRGAERYDEAVETYERVLGMPDSPAEGDWAFLYRYGMALERSGDWRKATEIFQEAAAINPDNPHLLNYLGYTWIDHGVELERGEALIAAAVDMRPENGYIVDSLGWVYYRTGRLQEAVETLERAAEFEPHDAVINDHLGDAYWSVGRRREAEYQWRRALLDNEDADLVLAVERKLVSYGLDPASDESRSRSVDIAE